MKILAALKNINGEFELGRLLLAGSGSLAITTPIGFQLADMWHNGWHFDVAAWCVAYPTGLGTLAGIGVFALGKKEKDIATARATDAATAAVVQSTEQAK